MIFYAKQLVLVAALALGSGMGLIPSLAENQQFKFVDMSKPTMIEGRIIMLDGDKKAVWLNLTFIEENADSDRWWFPGINLEFHPVDDEVWEKLKELGRCCPTSKEMNKIPPSDKAPWVRVLAQEMEKERLVIQSITEISSDERKNVIILPSKPKVKTIESLTDVYSSTPSFERKGFLTFGWKLSPVADKISANTEVEVLGSRQVGEGKFWQEIQYLSETEERKKGWIYCGNSKDSCFAAP